MLVLTRKTDEGIQIGEDITLRIIEIKSGSVRIGIDAPRETKIFRHEVYENICRENQEAAQWDMEIFDSLSGQIVSRKDDK